MVMYLKRIECGSHEEREYFLEPNLNRWRIGRGRCCDILFQSLFVSRSHCQIIKKTSNNNLVLQQLSVTNVTAIDDQVLKSKYEEADLNLGSKICLGAPFLDYIKNDSRFIQLELCQKIKEEKVSEPSADLVSIFNNLEDFNFSGRKELFTSKSENLVIKPSVSRNQVPYNLDKGQLSLESISVKEAPKNVQIFPEKIESKCLPTPVFKAKLCTNTKVCDRLLTRPVQTSPTKPKLRKNNFNVESRNFITGEKNSKSKNHVKELHASDVESVHNESNATNNFVMENVEVHSLTNSVRSTSMFQDQKTFDTIEITSDNENVDLQNEINSDFCNEVSRENNKSTQKSKVFVSKMENENESFKIKKELISLSETPDNVALVKEIKYEKMKIENQVANKERANQISIKTETHGKLFTTPINSDDIITLSDSDDSEIFIWNSPKKGKIEPRFKENATSSSKSEPERMISSDLNLGTKSSAAGVSCEVPKNCKRSYTKNSVKKEPLSSPKKEPLSSPPTDKLEVSQRKNQMSHLDIKSELENDCRNELTKETCNLNNSTKSKNWVSKTILNSIKKHNEGNNVINNNSNNETNDNLVEPLNVNYYNINIGSQTIIGSETNNVGTTPEQILTDTNSSQPKIQQKHSRPLNYTNDLDKIGSNVKRKRGIEKLNNLETATPRNENNCNMCQNSANIADDFVATKNGDDNSNKSSSGSSSPTRFRRRKRRRIIRVLYSSSESESDNDLPTVNMEIPNENRIEEIRSAMTMEICNESKEISSTGNLPTENMEIRNESKEISSNSNLPTENMEIRNEISCNSNLLTEHMEIRNENRIEGIVTNNNLSTVNMEKLSENKIEQISSEVNMETCNASKITEILSNNNLPTENMVILGESKFTEISSDDNLPTVNMEICNENGIEKISKIKKESNKLNEICTKIKEERSENDGEINSMAIKTANFDETNSVNPNGNRVEEVAPIKKEFPKIKEELSNNINGKLNYVLVKTENVDEMNHEETDSNSEEDIEIIYSQTNDMIYLSSSDEDEQTKIKKEASFDFNFSNLDDDDDDDDVPFGSLENVTESSFEEVENVEEKESEPDREENIMKQLTDHQAVEKSEKMPSVDNLKSNNSFFANNKKDDNTFSGFDVTVANNEKGGNSLSDVTENIESKNLQNTVNDSKIENEWWPQLSQEFFEVSSQCGSTETDSINDGVVINEHVASAESLESDRENREDELAKIEEILSGDKKAVVKLTKTDFVKSSSLSRKKRKDATTSKRRGSKNENINKHSKHRVDFDFKKDDECKSDGKTNNVNRTKKIDRNVYSKVCHKSEKIRKSESSENSADKRQIKKPNIQKVDKNKVETITHMKESEKSKSNITPRISTQDSKAVYKIPKKNRDPKLEKTCQVVCETDAGIKKMNIYLNLSSLQPSSIVARNNATPKLRYKPIKKNNLDSKNPEDSPQSINKKFKSILKSPYTEDKRRTGPIKKARFPPADKNLVAVKLISPRQEQVKIVQSGKSNKNYEGPQKVLYKEVYLKENKVNSFQYEFIKTISDWNYNWLINVQQFFKKSITGKGYKPPSVFKYCPLQLSYDNLKSYKLTYCSKIFYDFWDCVYKNWYCSTTKFFSCEVVSLQTKSYGGLMLFKINISSFILKKFPYSVLGSLISLKFKSNGVDAIIFGYIENTVCIELKDTKKSEQSSANFRLDLEILLSKKCIQSIKKGSMVEASFVLNYNVIYPYFKSYQFLCTLSESHLMNFVINPIHLMFLKATATAESLCRNIKNLKFSTEQCQIISEISIDCLTCAKKPKFSIIEGPPGTGKSTLICGLITQINNIFKSSEFGSSRRILLCAPTDRILDRLLEKLLSLKNNRIEFNIVRIGQVKNMSKSVVKYSLDNLIKIEMTELINLNNPEKVERLKAKENDCSKALENFNKACEKNFSADKRDELRKKWMNLLREKVELESNLKESIPKDQLNENQKLCRKKVILKSEIIATTFKSTSQECLLDFFKTDSLGTINRTFACCIIDDASQIKEYNSSFLFSLGILKFVLVGDVNTSLKIPDYQKRDFHATGKENLSPKNKVVTVNTENNFQISLFQRFYKIIESFQNKNDLTYQLRCQYRMNSEIWKFPCNYFYENLIPTVFSNKRCKLKPYFLLNYTTDEGTINLDDKKITCVIHAIIDSHKSFLKDYTVAILTTTQEQKFMIAEKLVNLKLDITVENFDAVDGLEKDIVYCNFLHPNKENFVDDRYRLNVALTRARFSCISIYSQQLIFGSMGPKFGTKSCSEVINLYTSQNKKDFYNYIKEAVDRNLVYNVHASSFTSFQTKFLQNYLRDVSTLKL